MSRIRDINPAAPSVKLSSIGISNVYERLYLIYGNQFRLAIDSKPGIGTVLQVMIPILTTE